jgi:hypothetical protein
MCIYINIYTHTYIYMCVCIHTHAHTHTHTHTHTQSWPQVFENSRKQSIVDTSVPSPKLKVRT